MGLKSDSWIRRMAREAEMIVPFAEGQVRPGMISFGLSSYGYDMRLDREFKLLRSPLPSLLDPKAIKPNLFEDQVGDYCIIPAHSFPGSIPRILQDPPLRPHPLPRQVHLCPLRDHRQCDPL